jgi:hypothetical protein
VNLRILAAILAVAIMSACEKEIVVATTTLPDAQVGVPYSQQLQGRNVDRWVLLTGMLPPGLQLSPTAADWSALDYGGLCLYRPGPPAAGICSDCVGRSGFVAGRPVGVTIMALNERVTGRFNALAENVKCPYCLTSVSSKADVCLGCRRDVRRLLIAEARVKELEENLPSEKPEAVSDTSSLTTQIILAFYALTTLTSWIEIAGYADNASKFVAIPSAIVTAAALSFATPVCRLTYLFFVGFGQPAFVCLALLALDIAPISNLPALAPPALAEGFQAGATMALAGIFASRFWLRKPVELGWSALWQQGSEFDRFERVALRIAGIATPLVTIGAKLLPFLFPDWFPSGK